MSLLTSAASIASRGLLALPGYEPKHQPDESIRDFLAGSAAALGRPDVSHPLKVLEDHLVDNVCDLQLLVQEGLLREIGLPIRLCVWIEEELSSLLPSATAPQPPPLHHVASTPVLSAPGLSLSSSFSLSSPPPAPRHFMYQSDLDTNGVLYFLGTQGLTAAWVNPVSTGRVAVSCSSVMKDSQPMDAVVGRSVVRCVTAADPNAWICVELRDVWVRPTAYTLRHYASWDTECVRNWRLEASRDGKLWTSLSVHANDLSINGAGATHTWQLTASHPSPPLHDYHRLFRLFLTGANSNNHLYLACSGFELYGAMLTAEQYSAAAAAMIASPQSAPPFPTSASFTAANGAVALTNGIHTSAAAAGSEDVEMKNPLSISSPAFSSHSFSSPAAGQLFVHQHELDHNGLLYAIATNNHTEPWCNPAEAGRVVVSSSSLLEDSAPLSAIVGPDVVRCVTQPRAGSWIRLDLLDKTLVLTAYTLRHYASWDTEALRCWRLEGSVDGEAWTTLREHVNDCSLDAKGKAVTFTLDASNPACQAAYRLFRITQTSENSNKHHYLACSGWELYGQLFAADGHSTYAWPPPQPAAASSSVLSRSSPSFSSSSFSSVVSSSSSSPSPSSAFTLTYASDFDTNGVIHHIATHASFRPWVNPHTAGLLTVAASSLADDSVGVDAIVGHDVVRCVTQNEAGSWFSIDLHGRLLLLTAYTLRHYSSWDTECLRNWRLEASRDGEQWDVLREHENDETLKGKGSSHTWQVGCSVAYSRFRIIQTRENSNRHHYLACSGWEMYGVLHEKPDSNGTEPMDVSADAAAAAAMPVSPLAVVPPSVVSLSSSSTHAVFSSPTSAQASPGGHELQRPLAPSAAHFFPASAAPSFASADVASLASSMQTAATASSQAFFSGASAASSPAYSYQWDSFERGGFLLVSGSVVRNSGSADKWQMVRSVQSFSSGHHRIAVRVTSDPQTSNTWRFIVGVVPATLDCSGSKQWVGTGGSWGYIAGTGGKCHNAARSDDYGERWGDGDVIGIVLDFDARSIEFWRNDSKQGVAYSDLEGPVHIAASLTATDSQLALVPFLYGREDDTDRSVNAQRACTTADVSFPASATAAPPAVSAASATAAPSFFSGVQHGLSITPSSSPHSQPSFNRAATLPAPLSLPQALSSCWDPVHKSAFLTLDASQTVVRNSGSSDKWQCVRSLSAFTRPPSSSSAVHSFRIELLETPATPNSWQMIVGVVPAAFTCQGNKQWVGAAGSWGYIAGTGGKCYGEPKSRAYGEQWGRAGDVLHCRIDLDAGSIEFSKNGVSQGVAFAEGVVPPVYAAVSLTATGAAVRLIMES